MASEGFFNNLARAIVTGFRRLTDETGIPSPTYDNEVFHSDVANKSLREKSVFSFEPEDISKQLKPVSDSHKVGEVTKSISAPAAIYTYPFEGYHLDMSGFYNEAIKSLPKYRRNIEHSGDWNSGYVQNSVSEIPCSPRLVQRDNRQKQVVTRMLRSYPQPDGSFICPIPLPGKHIDQPPPLPSKARDRHRVTNPSSNTESHTAAYQNSDQRYTSYPAVNEGKPLLYKSSNTCRQRSTSHQPLANDLCNKTSYVRMNSYPINTSPTSSTLIISTETAQPQHTITTGQVQQSHGVRTQRPHSVHTSTHSVTSKHNHRQQSVDVGTPLHYAAATYIDDPTSRITRSNSQRSAISDTSSSTYTGAMEAPVTTRDGSPKWTSKQCNVRSSLVECSTNSEYEENLPELYPEQRVEVPVTLRIKPRTQVKMTCFDMLHNAHHVLEFLSHKVDILEQSLLLFANKLSEMSDLAVTTPPCTQIDTEFCICHQAFDGTKLGHGIWKYFCDANKCNFCCQLFEQLANRPNSMCQLSVLDLNLNIILSGALIISGEDNGSLVVFIRAQGSIWSNCDEDCLLDLSNFVEYISSTVRNDLIKVIVDARQAPEPITQLIMDSLQNAERNSKGGISEVSVVVDRPSHTPQRLFKPLGTAGKTTVVEINYCSLSDCALKLSPEKLPAQLGGTYQFDPDSWIRSYACLEKKVQQHQRAFGEIFNSTHNLSLVPRTIRHAGNVIHQHKNSVDVIDRTTKLLDRSKYTEEGSRYPPDVDDVNSCNILRDAEIRQLLDDLNTFMTGTHVFRDVMDSLQSLGQTRREVSRLKVLAESRLSKLQDCRQLWCCIEEITKTLTLLRRAHDLINKHRVISNNLKAAQVQYNNFNKVKPSVMKLVAQGNELLEDSRKLLTEVGSPIPWLEQLSSKLHAELSFLTSFMEKTELLVTDTFHCYKTLDQAYDWAVESMKFVSSMNMDECLSEEGVEKLSANLSSFIKAHKIIDKNVFDDVSLKAKNLGNKKLVDQSRIARSRCEETKHVLKVRETTIVKAKEEIEAQKAKRISLEQLVAGTNIIPLTALVRTESSPTLEDIWIPQTSSDSKSVQSKTMAASQTETTDETNNNGSSECKPKQTIKYVHSRTKSEDSGLVMSYSPSSGQTLTESLDTMASSQEDIISTDSDVQSQSPRNKIHGVSPIVVSDQLKEETMVKRRSFAGFTPSTAFPSFSELSKASKASSDKRLSSDASELDEGLATIDGDSSNHSNSELSKSVVEKLEELGIDRTPCNKVQRKKNQSLRDSVITGSSDSLTSCHEDQEILTEDSGALTKSSSSSASQDSHTNNQWSPVPVNSHLLQKKSSHQWQSLSDLRLTESEMRSRRTLSHIMDELMQTEKDYVMALKLVVEQYIPEMNREDAPQPLRGNRGVIFGNIEKIHDFHTHHFLKELIECAQEPFRISQCFLAHEKEFLMYALYNKNKPRSDSLMGEHGSAFFRELQLNMGDKMNLSSYLLKPVQRMGKYALILKQILKECPDSAAEYQDMSAAQDMIKFCLQHGNDLLAMDSLKECDVNLQEQGTLLLQEEFTVQKSRHKAAKRHLFLFDDLLVFAKAKKLSPGQDDFIYKSSLKTADLGLTENVGGSGTKLEIWFRKRSRVNWTLQAASVQIKNKWVATFEKILWNQAIKNRECRLTALSSMGIGLKPSLDLKPSEDNISDRTINTELTNKVNQRKSTPECGESDVQSTKPILSLKSSTDGSKSSSSSQRSVDSHSRKPTPFVPASQNIMFTHSSSASSLSSQTTSNHSTRHSDTTSLSGLHIVSATTGSISTPNDLSAPTNNTQQKVDCSDTKLGNTSSKVTSAAAAKVLTLLDEPMCLYESKV